MAIIGTASVVLLSLLTALTVKLVSRPEVLPTAMSSPQTKLSDEKTQSADGAKTESKAQSYKVADAENDAANKKAASPEKIVQGVKKSSRVRTLVETTGAPAVLNLVIVPWGEVYLDGRMQGVSPPLLELQVVAGRHVLKVRNTTFPDFTKVIMVKSGEKIKIRHSFAK